MIDMCLRRTVGKLMFLHFHEDIGKTAGLQMCLNRSQQIHTLHSECTLKHRRMTVCRSHSQPKVPQKSFLFSIHGAYMIQNTKHYQVLTNYCNPICCPYSVERYSTDFGKSTQSSGGVKSLDSESDSEDDAILPALKAVTPNIPPPHAVEVVPGKGPPPEPPVHCCMSGCANCVWITYAEELKAYFSKAEGTVRAKKAIEQIDDPGLKMFLKLELGLL